jgi:hypothetical protein
MYFIGLSPTGNILGTSRVTSELMIDDRRRRARLQLRYALQLSRPDLTAPVQTETDNLSSTGFYCTTEEPFSPGERLECDLLLPSNYLGSHTTNVVLHRWVKVVRVEIRGLEPGFGIACEFEEGILESVPQSNDEAHAGVAGSRASARQA